MFYLIYPLLDRFSADVGPNRHTRVVNADKYRTPVRIGKSAKTFDSLFFERGFKLDGL